MLNMDRCLSAVATASWMSFIAVGTEQVRVATKALDWGDRAAFEATGREGG